jgi:hypothetical protein
MSKDKKTDYRLKIVEPRGGTLGDHATYIVRKGDRVSYISGDETPLALSNLLWNGQSAEMRFTLEDALDGAAAAKALREVLAEQYKNAPKDKHPKVEVL